MYIELKDYAKNMGIEKGDIVMISSDAKIMLFDAMRNKASKDLNDFIDGLKEAVGAEGTILFPTYNWDFCKGVTFDIKNTPCLTGSLGSIALGRDDFRRTKHALYSFAVWGKYADELVAMENTDSFGLDSPFAFLREHNVKNFEIDVTLQHCFTFTHFVEENVGVPYRFIKNFTANYIDEVGSETERTYSMLVRYLDKDVTVTIDPIEPDLIAAGAARRFEINSSSILQVNFGDAYPVLENDIRNNNSGKLCEWKQL